MPQLDQLPLVAYSQLFWLLLVLAIIYFAIGKRMLPKIEATVEQRNKVIADDLAEAERARAEADRTEEAYRARMDESRAEALKVTQAAKQAMARETEQRLAAADAEIGEKVASAEARIMTAAEATMAEIEDVAAEAAQQMVVKLSGANVTREQAARAVKAAMANG
jgi:F-type H+-transporting ATPase subunit b